jgi:molybdopterin-guanine dinucleotide biosynthesis protein A
LGGIISALGAVNTDLVVVLACDLLAASPVAVTRLLASLGEGDLAVPVVEGRAQWLHAAWRRSAESALRTAFGVGERAPRRALGGLVTVEVVDASPTCYQDADTPNDLPPGAR